MIAVRLHNQTGQPHLCSGCKNASRSRGSQTAQSREAAAEQKWSGCELHNVLSCLRGDAEMSGRRLPTLGLRVCF